MKVKIYGKEIESGSGVVISELDGDIFLELCQDRLFISSPDKPEGKFIDIKSLLK